MTRLSLLIPALSLLLTASSCGNKTLPSKSPTDTIWNDSVQDTFYGMKLGDPITKDSVISILTSNGLALLEQASTENNLKFSSKKYMTISYEGMTCQNIMITIDNDKFKGIDFFNNYTGKEAATQNYELIKKEISKKYKLTPVTSKDSTASYRSMIYGRNNIEGVVGSFKKETPTEGTIIYNAIAYRIKNI